MRRLTLSLTLAIFASALASPFGASAAMTGSTYPAAQVGYLSYSPPGIKFGSGSTFQVKKWRNWGKRKAVGTGTLCDHCNTSYGLRAKGKIVLSRPKACGVDHVYTTYRLQFKGSQRRKAGFWRKARVVARTATLGCRGSGENTRVHLPSNWDVVADYPVTSDFEPLFAPGEFYPSRRLTVGSISGWSGWGGPLATTAATASVYDYWPECGNDGECARAVPVTVTASDPGHCWTWLIYRSLSVQPVFVSPSFTGWFAQIEGRSVKCQD